MKRLAAEMLPVFSSLQIRREALAALRLLVQAMAAERAGVETVEAAAEILRRGDPAAERG